LRTAADAAKDGIVDGILFAPLNKHAMRLGGLEEEDEMRFLQRHLGVKSFVTEFNITDALWTSRVTSHIPLREVADAITTGGVREAVLILAANLRAAASRAAHRGPRPQSHAGDGGKLWRRESSRSRAAGAIAPRRGP
jgi:4-hydroxythreonine-4-phosphate dehydrogenase